jgi:hypothetical protein
MATLYIVRRRLLGDERGPYTNGRIEKAFARREDAEHFRDERERRARHHRRDAHPFYLPQRDEVLPLDKVTSLDEPVFRDYLRDLGLEPPARKGYDAWSRWWREASPGMDDLTRARFWQALDLYRFYEVVEAPCGEVDP